MKFSHSKKLVFIRHGFSEGNEKNIFCGTTDVPLCDRGRAELRELRRKYAYPRTDLYICSDLSRCLETFVILYGSMPRIDERLREEYFGTLEGTTMGENRCILMDYFRRWLDGETPYDGESFDDCTHRVEGFLQDLSDELDSKNMSSATISTHCCLMRVMLIAIGAFRKEEFFDIKCTNGLGYVVDIDVNGKITVSDIPLFD